MAKRIDLEELTVRFGAASAVREVTLSIAPRTVTAFIGPSGSGKTSILRAMNRMHDNTPGASVDGQVLLDGADVYAARVDPVAVRRSIGMVFQRANPFPTKSVRDNVVAGIRLHGRHRRTVLDDACERALRRVHLWSEVANRLKLPAARLSYGQQQRLCIARALTLEPEVLLMDEPCSGLDPVTTLAVESLIAELKNDCTVVFVTHNMQQAARISDWTAFFSYDATTGAGSLVEYADTATLFSAPRKAHTEDYISGKVG